MLYMQGYGTGEFEQYIPENDAEGVDVAEIRDEIEQRIHQLAHMVRGLLIITKKERGTQF